MDPKKDITIYDIAQKLSLSSATVSRALQNHLAINKDTRKRVQETAKQLGYRHNNFASSLRKQKTNTIAVIVHELNCNFITSALAGIEKVTSGARYDLIIAHSAESFEKEIANANNLFHKRVDGLIASLAFNTTNLDHYLQYEEKGIPIVFFDRVDEKSNSTKVIIDNHKVGYEATKHLIEQGCKRIVLVTASLLRNVYALRHQGYLDALRDFNIPYDESLLIVNNLSEECGVEAALKILKMNQRPDAVFITNDFAAAICMQTLKDHGIRVPEDIAIVGFNNEPVSRVVQPKLTTVNYSGITIGETAARSLISHLNGQTDIKTTNTIVVNSELVIRESSLKRK